MSSDLVEQFLLMDSFLWTDKASFWELLNYKECGGQRLVVKNPPTNAGDVRDVGSIPGSGRFPREGNGNPLQYYCLESSVDRGAWLATVHRVRKELETTEHITILNFSGGSDGKASAYNAKDPGLIPELGKSSGEGNGNPL